MTRGHTVIMGRKTHESILSRLGKPLPERETIVITRQNDYVVPEHCVTVPSFEDALKIAPKDDEIFIFGGAEIYKTSLPFANRVYLTRVKAVIDGDAFFPALNMDEWTLVSEEKHSKDEKNEFDYTFSIYDRRQ